MRKENAPSDKERETNELIAQYEAAKANNKTIYLDGDQLAIIADQYIYEKEYDKAQEVITYGLGIHPGQTDIMVEQAYLFIELGKHDEAKEVAELITDTFATNVKILKAELLLGENKKEEANKMIESIDEEDKDELYTLIDIVYMYIEAEEFKEAFIWIERGFKLFKDNEEFMAAVADSYEAFGEDRLEEAKEAYNSLIDKDPYNPAYWLGLAKCQLRNEEYENSIESCEFAIAADETFSNAYITKAHCLVNLEDYEGSLKECEKALKYEKAAPEYIYMCIGLAHAQLNNWEEADENYCMAIDLIKKRGSDPSSCLPDLFMSRAISADYAKNPEKALYICQEFKELEPEDAAPYLLEGRIYLQQNNSEKAKEDFEKAIFYSPDIETRMTIAEYYINHSMLEEARTIYEEILEINPLYDPANSQLSIICLVKRDFKGFKKYNEMCEKPINLNLFKELFDTDGIKLIKEIKDFIDNID